MSLCISTIHLSAAAEMMSAIQSGDKTKCNEALKNYGQAIADTVKDSILVKDNDTMAYQQRGKRILTAQETKFYETIAKAGKSDNPKQYFATLDDPNDKIMPTTVIEDVFKTLVEEHPLLQRINFQSVEYLTRWILHDHKKQTAAWGDLTKLKSLRISFPHLLLLISQCSTSDLFFLMHISEHFLPKHSPQHSKKPLSAVPEKVSLSDLTEIFTEVWLYLTAHILKRLP